MCICVFQISANTALLASIASKHGINSAIYAQWAEDQISYMLGANGRSFVVGFGNNPPERPHHASSYVDFFFNL